jgi:hypothetical protein
MVEWVPDFPQKRPLLDVRIIRILGNMMGVDPLLWIDSITKDMVFWTKLKCGYGPDFYFSFLRKEPKSIIFEKNCLSSKASLIVLTWISTVLNEKCFWILS